MKKRPTSITIIAWYLIVTAPISLVAIPMSLNNPMAKEMMNRSLIPIPVQYFIMVLGLVICLITGIAMLKGKGWSRYLYVCWHIVTIIVNLATSPFKAAMVPATLLLLVYTIFVFRPVASEYFRAEASEMQ